MKYLIFILVLSTTLYTMSQEKFAKEISLVTDNDLYSSITKDRYYTSGIFLKYRYLSNKKNESLKKRILEWQINHEMYTPYKAIVENVFNHDRPFAGYLYGSFGINRIYKSEQILNTSIQFGVIGSNSFAEELQHFIHDIYGFKKAVGWKYQIKNAIGLNFKAAYLKPVLKTENDYFDITWTNKLNIGTVYTNISSGFYTRIGLKPLQKLTNSIAFNTNINNEETTYNREIESFIYIKPMLRYAFYDATLQGSFLNKESEVTNTLVPLVFNVDIGILFTANRFNFGYVFKYNTNKSKDLKYHYGQKYGTIILSYLIR